MAALADENGVLVRLLADRVRDVHGLGGGGRLVEQRGVRDVQPGEIADHLLEVHQRLHAPLRNLRLIRRVGRVPAGIFEDVALDDRWRDAVAVALAEVVFAKVILSRDATQLGQRLVLATSRGQLHRLSQPDFRGHRRVDQRIERPESERRQHLRDLVFPRAEMASRKGVARREDRGFERSRSGRRSERVVHRGRLETKAGKASGFWGGAGRREKRGHPERRSRQTQAGGNGLKGPQTICGRRRGAGRMK